MGMALYRKYRTTSLADTLGQEHITTTLDNALKNGKISHAYLFTGPRGVGKTSVARILAHEVNNLPYTDDTNHLDIIEIDAASNRRIDEIRELRERVHTAPTSASYKVYIIDEVHMLTKEAFNALLKTLEEPPKHVIFILATTEFHKLPETIVSRTQHFSFKPYETAVIQDRLRFIAQQEHIDITDGALQLIARAGGGSFRDSISLLDQASNNSVQVDEVEARRLLGIVPEDSAQQLLDAISRGDPQETMKLLQGLRSGGFQSTQIAKQLIATLRESLVDGKTAFHNLFSLATELLDVPSSYDPDTKLDLIVLGRVLSGSTRPSISTAPEQPRTPEKRPSTPPIVAVAKPVQPARQTDESRPTQSSPVVSSSGIDDTGETPSWWTDVLAAIKQKHNTIYSVVRMAKPTVSDTTLTLSFAFPFHQKRINEAKNKQIIADITHSISGQSFSIHCIVHQQNNQPAAAAAQPAQSNDAGPDLSAIKNIFGDAEVLPE